MTSLDGHEFLVYLLVGGGFLTLSSFHGVDTKKASYPHPNPCNTLQKEYYAYSAKGGDKLQSVQ